LNCFFYTAIYNNTVLLQNGEYRVGIIPIFAAVAGVEPAALWLRLIPCLQLKLKNGGWQYFF
jgi:hypothetical protein